MKIYYFGENKKYKVTVFSDAEHAFLMKKYHDRFDDIYGEKTFEERKHLSYDCGKYSGKEGWRPRKALRKIEKYTESWWKS